MDVSMYSQFVIIIIIIILLASGVFVCFFVCIFYDFVCSPYTFGILKFEYIVMKIQTYLKTIM